MPSYKHLKTNKFVKVIPGGDPTRAMVYCWTPDDVAMKKYGEKYGGNFGVIGPCRTMKGIDLLVRSLMFNPHITTLVVCGPDLQDGMVKGMLLLTWKGMNHQFIGDDVPYEEIKKVTDRVTLHIYDSSGMEAGTVEGHQNVHLDSDDGFRPLERVAYPPPLPDEGYTAPHGLPGQRISSPGIKGLWEQAVQQTMRYGRDIDTHYGATKDYCGLVSVLTDPDRIFDDLDSGELPFSRADLYQYTNQLRLPSTGEAREVEYTYGDRIRGSFDEGHVDQVDYLHHMLQNKPEYRGIYMSTWHPDKDSQTHAKGRPCMVGIQWRVMEGTLHLTAIFRSHDLFAAYQKNLGALTLWLIDEATDRGMKVGLVTMLSVSAHVYEDDWTAAWELVKSYKGPMFDWDQRSNWFITADDDGQIVATAYNRESQSTVMEFKSSNPARLLREIRDSGLVTSTGGALWLGGEVMRVHLQMGE